MYIEDETVRVRVRHLRDLSMLSKGLNTKAIFSTLLLWLAVETHFLPLSGDSSGHAILSSG